MWHKKPTHTHRRLHTSLTSPVHYKEEILSIGSTTEERGRVTCFLSVSFSPRAPGASSSWFPPNKPPAGCLNRPLINPSVGSLLRPQPSEEGSNPAKQTERRLTAHGEHERRRFHSCKPNDFCSWILQVNIILSVWGVVLIYIVEQEAICGCEYKRAVITHTSTPENTGTLTICMPWQEADCCLCRKIVLSCNWGSTMKKCSKLQNVIAQQPL